MHCKNLKRGESPKISTDDYVSSRGVLATSGPAQDGEDNIARYFV
jgi:hypothetical protein